MSDLTNKNSKNPAKQTPKATYEKFNVEDSTEVVVKKKRKSSILIKVLVGVLVFGVVATAVIVPSVLLTRRKGGSSTTSLTTYAISTTLEVSASDYMTESETSTAGTQMMVTNTCPPNLATTATVTCINTDTDFDNCGMVGFACSSNYTYCENGICTLESASPLLGATAIPDWQNGDFDDYQIGMELPFPITLYNYSTMSVYVTTNGIVCLGNCSNAYTNGILPSASFNGTTAFGFWDDLQIYVSKSNAVYYGSYGTSPYRRMIFDFDTSYYRAPSQFYRFQIIFYESSPNIVRYVYFSISDGGRSATIGVQSSAFGPHITYSVDQTNAVQDSTSLVFNTKRGVFSSSLITN